MVRGKYSCLLWEIHVLGHFFRVWKAVTWVLFASFFLPQHPPPLKANVMLEYDIDEAQALLEKNLSTASRNLETLEDDLDFLRDQFTTTEVSILPLHRPRRLGMLLIQSDRKCCRTVSETSFLFLFQSGNTSGPHCFYCFVPWHLHYKKIVDWK